MCGIIGIISSDKNKNISHKLIDALTILQHRGQDSSGIYTLENGRFHIHKAVGPVDKVFKNVNPSNIPGNKGIGHVRYSTSGTINAAEVQPLYVNSPYGISLVHNGNLTNTDELREKLVNECGRHINSSSDSEVLLNVIAHELSEKCKHIETETEKNRTISETVFECVHHVMNQCQGGYAVIVLISGVGMMAFRDPFGIRPLCLGSREVDGHKDYAFASESIAFDMLRENYKLVRDVKNGECIFIDNKYNFYSKIVCSEYVNKGVNVNTRTYLSPCLFEYIYFARPDSIIDGISVYKARKILGKILAIKILEHMQSKEIDTDIDVVMPIPETSRIAALEIAMVLNKPYEEGFIKNRYIPRTFIMPEQKTRIKNVQLKLNTIKEIFLDKNVLIIDDSIVRGTTSRELVKLAREAGAKKIYFASTAPPIIYPNVYGIDIPVRHELIAYDKNKREIAAELGADFVVYNDLREITTKLGDLNKEIEGFETSCFDGDYISGDIGASYLGTLEKRRATK